MFEQPQIFGRIEGFLTSFRYESTTLVRTVRAFGLVLLVFVIGTLGYWLLSEQEYSLLECAYMTVITLTTVGFGEVIPVAEHPKMEAFTMIIIVVGMGGMLYFASSLTAFIVDGELRNLIRLRRMQQEINELENHYIVAGVGNTGEYVLDEILSSRRSCVVIDSSRERIDEVRDDHDYDFPFLVGDATDDDILEAAGIDRATGLICSLGNDRDNLFVTISARSLNPDLKIITRGSSPDSEQKFKMAGATSVIYTNVLGGMRMAAEAIRPSVTTFLDLMMQDHGHYRRVEEFEIPEGSPLVGEAIRDSTIRQKTDALIIAVWEPEDDDYVYNPGPSYKLSPHSKLIVLTLVEDIPQINEIIAGGDADDSLHGEHDPLSET